MAIETRYYNSTDLQILGEILNTLNKMPVTPTPWIGTPPFLDSKTDLLYEIWQKLLLGGIGASADCCNVLTFDTNIAGAQIQTLPAKSFVESVIVYSPVVKNGVSLGLVAGDAELFFYPVDFAAGESKTFTPGVFLPAGGTLFTANTNLAGNFFTIVINYKILTRYQYVAPIA